MDDQSERADTPAAKSGMVRVAFAPRGVPPVPDGTPEEIREKITWEPRVPSDLDRPVPSKPAEGVSTAKHRLVVLGDSISQGFKSLAIRDTRLSWPAMVARYGGIEHFRFPWYDGPEGCEGLPFNLEQAVRSLDWPGSVLDPRAAEVPIKLRRLLDKVEDYWERGDGATAVEGATYGGPDLSRAHHNLAIWGQDLRDAMSLDVKTLKDRVVNARRRHDEPFRQFASSAAERSALITLEGGADDDTPVSLAKKLGDDGGIETLVVGLGSNNILGTVINFEIKWTFDDYADVDGKRNYNAWTPEHFRSEFDALLERVKEINAQHVIFFTVPHVTIAPMVRGVGYKMPADRYFARYTRPWISDDRFSPNLNPCITGDELRVLDFAVDLYNDHICKRVEPLDGHDERRWAVLDIAGILDRLAYRRYIIDDEARPDWWQPYDLPDEYRELSPRPDTRFIKSDRFGRIEGGLFGLDGIHPTTIGYGLLAREVMRLMTVLGVPLKRVEPDFADVINRDTLIKSPLERLASVLTAVGSANHLIDLYQAVRHARPI